MATDLHIRFDGGLASTGQLHFYEYSRSQYALARLIATVEHFRRTGEIAEKINKNNYVDIVISTPRRGSFVEIISIPEVKEIASLFVSISIDKLLYFVWNIVSPRSENTDRDVTELAKIELKKERERTKQLKQETERLRILERITVGERANTKFALDIVESQRKDIENMRGKSEIDIARLNELVQLLSAELAREESIAESADELDKISTSKVVRLASRIRPLLAESALPLRRSADLFEIGTRGRRGVFIDKTIVKELESRNVSEKEISIEGFIKTYDKISGIGKFVPKELNENIRKTLSFVVPNVEKQRSRNAILDAMKLDRLTIYFFAVTDENDIVTSLIFSRFQYSEPP